MLLLLLLYIYIYCLLFRILSFLLKLAREAGLHAFERCMCTFDPPELAKLAFRWPPRYNPTNIDIAYPQFFTGVKWLPSVEAPWTPVAMAESCVLHARLRRALANAPGGSAGLPGRVRNHAQFGAGLALGWGWGDEGMARMGRGRKVRL